MIRGSLIKYQKNLETLIEEKTRELQLKNHELEELANRDPLTNLFNRRKFSDLLELEFKRHIRYKRPFCLLLMDIDHFKRVNDEYGHDVGDKVLREFVRRVLNTIRGSDCLARWGGEEFILLSPETEIDGVKIQADNLRAAIADYQFDTAGWISCSFGITAAQEDDENIDQIIKRADDALYHAKQNGRNRVELA